MVGTEEGLSPLTSKSGQQAQSTLERVGSATPTKIKKLFGPCFEFTTIENGDSIPAIISRDTGDVKVSVLADLTNFQTLFQDARAGMQALPLDIVRQQLDSSGAASMESATYAALVGFTRAFEGKYHYSDSLRDKENSQRESRRMDYYSDKSEPKRLSAVFKMGIEQCAEIAVLAQAYLQSVGIASTYFGGDILESSNDEFSEGHAFIVIRQGDDFYIYDPTRSIEANNKFYPRIFKSQTDFDKAMSRNQPTFVAAENIMSKDRISYFGISKGANVIPERDIIGFSDK